LLYGGAPATRVRRRNKLVNLLWLATHAQKIANRSLPRAVFWPTHHRGSGTRSSMPLQRENLNSRRLESSANRSLFYSWFFKGVNALDASLCMQKSSTNTVVLSHFAAIIISHARWVQWFVDLFGKIIMKWSTGLSFNIAIIWVSSYNPVLSSIENWQNIDALH